MLTLPSSSRRVLRVCSSHYHVLLWIRDAPVIGVDDPEKVLGWIQEKITCHIPDKESNPELHSLVTRYQMHKCSAYCKRKLKCGRSTFITRCRFGFPRQACENPKLNSVQDSLKTRNRIYQCNGWFHRSCSDYNGLKNDTVQFSFIECMVCRA